MYKRQAFIEYPYYTLEKEGVYGLELPLEEAVGSVLRGIIPKEKKSIISRISNQGNKLSAYIKKRPIRFGFLLVLLNQGVSDLLTEEVKDSPPDFPIQD